MATSIDVPQKKQKAYNKSTLGPTAGHGVTTLPCCRLWHLRCHKRSGTASVEKRKKLEEWMPPWYDSVLTLEEQNRVTAQAKRKFHSWVTRLPIEMNVHVANIFWRLLQIPAFFLTLKNQNFKSVTRTRAPSQPVALFFISFLVPFALYLQQFGTRTCHFAWYYLLYVGSSNVHVGFFKDLWGVI